MENISLCSDHQREKHIEVPRGCPTCTRINIERDIVLKTLVTLLAAGYSLEWDYINDENDGDEKPLNDFTLLKAQAMACDDEHLYVYSPKGHRVGWVYFVYGNDGWDVINDHTLSLEEVLAPVNEYAEKMQ